MIRLTVAHYYTPTGRDIQKPYTKGDQKAYHEDMLERFNHGEPDACRLNKIYRLAESGDSQGSIAPSTAEEAYIPINSCRSILRNSQNTTATLWQRVLSTDT